MISVGDFLNEVQDNTIDITVVLKNGVEENVDIHTAIYEYGEDTFTAWNVKDGMLYIYLD